MHICQNCGDEVEFVSDNKKWCSVCLLLEASTQLAEHTNCAYCEAGVGEAHTEEAK